jgi:hypothetical protein
LRKLPRPPARRKPPDAPRNLQTSFASLRPSNPHPIDGLRAVLGHMDFETALKH